MRIALICDVLGESNNGTVIATVNLISYLREKGHTVYVVSPDNTTVDMEDYYVVPTMHFGKLIDRAVEKNGVTLAKPDKVLLEKTIRSADIVHLQMPFALSKCAVKIANRLHKPISASFHCQAENFTSHIGAMNNRLVNHIVYQNFYRTVYSQCTAIHYPTEFIRQLFYSNTRCSVPYYVISNGVSDEFFVQPPYRMRNDKFTIICTGRYSKEKSQKDLIKAVARSKYRDSFRLIFAGDGPMKGRLERLSRKEKVHCEFRFFERPELVKALQHSDLYVHTSVVEIEAIACMEAIAAGLVTVICDSKRSATRFFAVDDRTLFKPNNPKDLCEKIEYFYENRDVMDTYRKQFEMYNRTLRQSDCMAQMERMLLKTAKAEHQ